MTKTKAKHVSLKLWTWLSEHPGEDKSAYPGFEEIKKYPSYCALCALFLNYGCRGCPLGHCMSNHKSPYYMWYNNHFNMDAAREILQKIKEWKV